MYTGTFQTGPSLRKLRVRYRYRTKKVSNWSLTWEEWEWSSGIWGTEVQNPPVLSPRLALLHSEQRERIYMITTITFGNCFHRRGSEVKFVQGYRIHEGKMDHKKEKFLWRWRGMEVLLKLKNTFKEGFYVEEKIKNSESGLDSEKRRIWIQIK